MYYSIHVETFPLEEQKHKMDFICEQTGEELAYAIVDLNPEVDLDCISVFIDEVYIKEYYRGAGLLREMINHIEFFAEKKNIFCLTLQASPLDEFNSQDTLISKYESIGFSIIKRESPVDGRINDYVLMMKYI